jgi:hypothetical protein
VHRVTATAANEVDLEQMGDLPYGKEDISSGHMSWRDGALGTSDEVCFEKFSGQGDKCRHQWSADT